MKTRTGKIARLPKAVREQLNRRLADGEQGEALLEWLHSLPEVLAVLVRDFGARPISKQNLSEWRQGGFRDWEERQERLEQIRLLAEEAEDTQETAPELADRMAALLAGRFANVIAATMQVKDWSKPRHRAQLMEMNEAVATLRRFDQGKERLNLERRQMEIHEAELHLAREARMKRTKEEWREWTRDQVNRLHKTCRTPEELLEAFNHLFFGEKEDPASEKETRAGEPDEDRIKLAASIIRRRDEIARDKADIEVRENQLKVRQREAQDAVDEAIQELLSKADPGITSPDNDTHQTPPPPQESQDQSNPVKP